METRRCKRPNIIYVATAPSVMYVSTCEPETYSPGEGISSLPAARILYTYYFCASVLRFYSDMLCGTVQWHRAVELFERTVVFYFLFLFSIL